MSSNQTNNQTPPPKLGKNMMYFAWVIGLFLLTTFFGVWEEKQFNPNNAPKSLKTSESTEVSLLRNRFGHYVTSGEINNFPVTFLVDTGATNVAIPGELEQSLNLKRGRQHMVHTANGTAAAYLTTLESLKIGELELFNVRASITPGMGGQEILLGMSVLNQLEFSQKGRQLILRQPH